MKGPIRPILLLTALAVCGCGGADPRAPIVVKGGSDAPAARPDPQTGELATSKTNTKPEAFNRANFLRLDLGPSVAELGEIFGPPQEAYPESKDIRRYTWKIGKEQLRVDVRDGKAVASLYPGEFEERKNRTAAIVAAGWLMDLMRKHVLKNKNRFPERLEDLDATEFARLSPESQAMLKRGDAVFPWGKSANRLVWAWWKDTPQHGGPYIRFDGKRFDIISPKEFARLETVVLTADTIPAEIAAESKPKPGEPATNAAVERKGVGAQGFFTAHVLAPLLKTEPGSLDEVAKHMVRNHWDVDALRMLEKREILVRWGRDPKTCVYAYPRNFPKAGDPDGWAIYKGQWAPFERIEEAKKAFAE